MYVPFCNVQSILMLDGGGTDYVRDELGWYTFQVAINDLINRPIPGVVVTIGFPRASYWGLTEGYNYVFCNHQDPGIQYHNFLGEDQFDATTGLDLALALFQLRSDHRQLIENRSFFFVVPRPDGARPLEGHVLIEMGDPCLPNLLVDPAHREGNVDGHYRRLMALDHQDRQTIGQFMLDDATPAFANQPIQRDALFWEHEGNAAVRVGDWKLVRLGRNGPWELYNLKTDRTELHDLATAEPARAAELAGKWEAWAARTNVKPYPDAGKKANKKGQKKQPASAS